MENQLISVIIPARDAAETIGACLQGVLDQQDLPCSLEIILVDDGSTDDTAQIAEALGVQVIRQENAGPAAARNLGAEKARGDILVFTDADCIPSPDWIRHLIAPFENPEVIGTKGAYRTCQRGLVPRFVQQEYGFKYARMSTLERIDFIDTYSAAYRRGVFMENGGFETAFAAPSVEDQEFSFRLARKGYLLKFVPQAVVYHQHDRDIKEYLQRKFGIGYWKAFMLRWLPEKSFNDSHTPPTLRWQILLLAVALVSFPPSIWYWQVGRWYLLGVIALFYASAAPFVRHIGRRDPPVLWITPVMLLLRAGALGFGLLVGLFVPPKRTPRPHVGLSPLHRLLKRSMDVVGALLGLALSFPVMLLAAIAIKLDSPGPVIFAQERAGENNRPFRLFKLRTMVLGASERVGHVLSQNTLRGPVFKIPDDPRITRVGRFLRRWSLDEIPQFWNVLKGEMSLVGPRPEETWVVAQYNDEQRQRLAVKPGLTGPMQISGRGELDMNERLELELEYIRDYSLGKDVLILLRTIPAVISGKGAF